MTNRNERPAAIGESRTENSGFRYSVNALIGEYFLAPSSLQRIALQGEVLVRGGDSRIANEHLNLSDRFSGLTSLRFNYVLFLSGNGSFSGRGALDRRLGFRFAYWPATPV